MDHIAHITHPGTGAHVVSYSLHQVLQNFIKMSDKHCLFAEVHQADISLPTHMITPNTLEVERLIVMMNKKSASLKKNMLTEQGFPEEFIKDLIHKSCETTMIAKMH